MTAWGRGAEGGTVAVTLTGYEHGPKAQRYGLEAGEAWGLRGEQVCRALMALVDDVPVVAMVPVAHQLDLKCLARAHGGKKAQMCPADKAQRLTGYVLGGISPLGQKKRLPVYLDGSA